jgi:outer membrane protein assembly factor BamB
MMWLCDTAGTILAIEPTAAAVHPLFTVSSFRTSAGFVPAELDGERGADFLFVDPFNRIVAVSGRDGTPLWNFGDAPDSVLHAPVVVPADGRIPQVVFAAQDGTVIALDGRNGWALWKNPLQSAVKSAVVAADAFGDSRPELFVCSSSRKLFCLALDGRTAWKTDLPSEPEGTVLCADMNRDGAKEIVLSLVDGTVLCLCPTGVTLWTLPGDVPVIPGGLVSASVSKGRKVLVLADANGFLRLIDAANGNLLGSSELPVPPVSALTVRGSKVFFAGRDGQVHEAEILCP